MSTLDTGLTFIRTASRRVSRASEWLGRWFKELMPKGLYARALLIIIVSSNVERMNYYLSKKFWHILYTVCPGSSDPT